LLSRLKGKELSLFVGALAVVLTVSPLVAVVLNSIQPPSSLPFDFEEFTLVNFATVFGTIKVLPLLANTFVFAVGSTALGLVLATAISWLAENTDMPFRRGIYAFLYIFLPLPIFVKVLGWIILLSPRSGILNVWLRSALELDGLTGPLNIFNVGSMIFITGVGITPAMVLLISAVMRNMDASLEDAAATAGATRGTVLRYVTLPLMAPGLVSAGIYFTMVHVQLLDTPLMVGLAAGFPVLSTQIFLLTEEGRRGLPEFGLAAAYGVTLLLPALLLLWIYFKRTRLMQQFQVIRGRATRRQYPLGVWRVPALVGVLLVPGTLLLPLLAIIWTSLVPFYIAPSAESLGMLTFKHYTEIFASRLPRQAIVNTLLTTPIAGLITVSLAFLLSWVATGIGMQRRARWLDTVAFLPVALPPVVVALGLAALAAKTRLFGTLSVIVLGFIITSLAYTARIMGAAVMQIHNELVEAARVSGASTLASMLYIVLPQVWPAFLNGMLYVTSRSMRDLVVPLMLMSSDTVLLGPLIYRLWQQPDLPSASALSVILLIMAAATVLPFYFLGETKTKVTAQAI
jgi:iron(III) transport system permease protein